MAVFQSDYDALPELLLFWHKQHVGYREAKRQHDRNAFFQRDMAIRAALMHVMQERLCRETPGKPVPMVTESDIGKALVKNEKYILHTAMSYPVEMFELTLKQLLGIVVADETQLEPKEIT